MKAIVTGGAGFIGSHLCDRILADNRNDVHIFDNFHSGKMENLNPRASCELRPVDMSRVGDYTGRWSSVDTVFHLAAHTSVQKSITNPIVTMSANIHGTMNMLELCRYNGIKNFVYVSSAAVYGDTDIIPTPESAPIKPLSPYGISKYTGEQLCEFYSKHYGIKAAIIRPFNVYGPRQDPRSEYAAVIPKFIARVKAGEQPIIYGDGMQTRDFIYVGDVVEALVTAAGHTGTYNVGSGIATTVNDLAHIITDLAGMECKPIYEPERPGDIKFSLSDTFYIKNSLMFEPQTPLKKGLKITYGG
jgi:UDP-glucose 4-epimerase